MELVGVGVEDNKDVEGQNCKTRLERPLDQQHSTSQLLKKSNRFMTYLEAPIYRRIKLLK